MGGVRAPRDNYETVVGSGEQCVPNNGLSDQRQCGDAGRAKSSQLTYPKGLAFDKDGVLYFADGSVIRSVDPEGIIRTVVGGIQEPVDWRPLACNTTSTPARQAQLQWPTCVALNPLDGSLYILDSPLIYRLSPDQRTLSVVAGAPLHCRPTPPLQYTDMAFSPQGHLYLLEPAGRVGVLYSDGQMGEYVRAGGQMVAVTVTADGTIYLSDRQKVYSVHPALPALDQQGRYEIFHPHTQESYIFNRFGQHQSTRDLVTGLFLYNFTYNTNSYFGKLTEIVDASSRALRIIRSYNMQVREILPPTGPKCRFTMDNMGQLESFTSADNLTTVFKYVANTGLLDYKQSGVSTVIYSYNSNGRLQQVIQPTGEVLSVHTGVTTQHTVSDVSRASDWSRLSGTGGVPGATVLIPGVLSLIATDFLLTFLHGASSTRLEYSRNRSLSVTYPSGLTLGVDSTPHPLPSTLVGLEVRRVLGPHQMAWRHLVANRTLRVNDPDPVLTVQYEVDDHTETVYNWKNQVVLKVQYNMAGQIVSVRSLLPSLLGLNLTYNGQGQLTYWQRGTLRMEYVYSNQVIEEWRTGNRATYRYLYKTGNKPTDIILPSGRQYVLQYSLSGSLATIRTPSLSHHRFHYLLSLGVHRLLYHPPDAHSYYLVDRDAAGQVQQVLFPSTYRRQTYHYDSDGHMTMLFFDWSDVSYGYHDNGLYSSINRTDRLGFQTSIVYPDSLALSEVVHVLLPQPFHNATFHYTYDDSLRLKAVTSIVAGYQMTLNLTFHPATGRPLSQATYTWSYPDANEVLMQDNNVRMQYAYDLLGRLSRVRMAFNTHVKYEMDLQYDAFSDRLTRWSRKVGISDIKSYDYVYDIDSNVKQVNEKGTTSWMFDYDEESNINKMQFYNKETRVEFNLNNQVESVGEQSYVYDKDGFLIQRGSQIFEYNSMGNLTRSFQESAFDVRYYYDGFHRLAVRHNVVTDSKTQYFYGHIQKPHLLTHIYENGGVTAFFYNEFQQVFAMKRSSEDFYIALDSVDSPIVIFNSIGGIVGQMTYSPLGDKQTSTLSFQLGFQSGIHDADSQVVFLKGRVYDPHCGRFTTPDYQQLIDDINRVFQEPTISNHYMYRHIFNKYRPLDLMNDLDSWSTAIGYNLANLMPQLSPSGQLPYAPYPHPSPLVPVTSAFSCALCRDLKLLEHLSAVPRSKVLPPHSSLYVSGYQTVAQPFGAGLMLWTRQQRVLVDVLEGADETLAAVATTLLNGSQLVPLGHSVHGKLVHYLVKGSLDQAQSDARSLGLQPDGLMLRPSGVNISIHRHHQSQADMRYVDYRVHTTQVVLNVRYGTTLEEEHDRVVRHAVQTAAADTWLIERELAQSAKLSVNKWSAEHRRQLLANGQVPGVRPVTIRDVTKYPRLAEDPNNIRFVSTEN